MKPSHKRALARVMVFLGGGSFTWAIADSRWWLLVPALLTAVVGTLLLERGYRDEERCPH